MQKMHPCFVKLQHQHLVWKLLLHRLKIGAKYVLGFFFSIFYDFFQRGLRLNYQARPLQLQCIFNGDARVIKLFDYSSHPFLEIVKRWQQWIIWLELARATRMLRCVLHSGVKVSYSGAIGQGRDGFNGYKVDWYCDGGTLGHSRALWGNPGNR